MDDEEYPVSFLDCICEHDPGQHGWGSCDVDECLCDGGWAE